MKLTVHFKPQKLSVSFKPQTLGISAGLAVAREYVERPAYEGEYTVIPSEEEQVLQTKNKRMTDNVVVKEVPFGLATTAQINRLFE